MKKINYDIIIIGAGSGGLNLSSFLSKINLKVLLVDKSDKNIGGDCLNTGCVPSKALIHIANQVHEGRLSNRFLVEGNLSVVDIKKVTDYVKLKQEIFRKNENPEYLKNKKIDYISGVSRFVDENTISLNGVLYTAKNFILSTGSRARKSSAENDSSIKEYNNENIFSIDFLPKEFVFIGGGPINCELGQAFSRLGSKVTILNNGKRILEKEALTVSLFMEDLFYKEGINIINNVNIEKIYQNKIYFKKNNSNEGSEIQVDAIFWGIGRELNIDNLDLDKAGIFLNENKTKIIVDDYLKTTNSHIYAAGDVAGNYQFTHAAEMHTKIIINNLISPLKKKFNGEKMAWVTYTSPEIATFGISYEEAEKKDLHIISTDFNSEDRAIVDENQDGKVYLYLDKKGVIKGGTMVSKDAGEISQELILLMSQEMPLDVLFDKVYPYPTASRINRQISAEWLGRKLNNKNKKILEILFNIFSR